MTFFKNEHMKNFVTFNTSTKNQIVQLRSSEVKFGERVRYPEMNQSIDDFLKTTDARFILLGIPEDIGIKANLGRTGSRNAWEQTLQTLLNIQHNKTCKGSDLGILGKFDFQEWQQEADTLDAKIPEQRLRLFELVSLIDKEVAYFINKIVKAGKTPIIIGGGHNNAYGNIKGLALGKNSMVNAVNFDAHTDFRPLEGRHSGNGFSYAFEEDFLHHYFIFGLHENYTSKAVFSHIKEQSNFVKYNTLEQMKVRLEKSFLSEIHTALQHVKDLPYGVEIDLDSIENVASSAITPSGFSSLEARQFVYHISKHKNASYLHLCEAAPTLDAPQNMHLTGKLSAYLITDFIKAKTQQ